MEPKNKEGPFSVDPETSERIRQWQEFQGTGLEGRILFDPERPRPDNSELSDKDKARLLRLAKIAVLSRPRTHERRLRVLGVLKRGGYSPRDDYLKMPEEKLKDYFEKEVVPDLGLHVARYLNYSTFQKLLTYAAELDSRRS